MATSRLKAKPPEQIIPRLKMLVYGGAGVGKTTAALNFKRAYVIDGEKGTQHYADLIRQSGSVVLETSDMQEVIGEVKTLLTEQHPYRTLVIDPITTIWNDLVDQCEKKVGSEFGRHVGEAGKHFKRLFNLLTALDMNVILTAHSKVEYGEGLVKLGTTFDGFKKLEFLFDLVIELERDRKSKVRRGRVVKTRLKQFPDGDVFPWSYEEFTKRYDPSVLEREAQAVALASPEQVREMKDLLNLVRLPEGTVEKWWAKAQVDAWEDLPAETMTKCLDYVKGRLPGSASAPSPNGDRRVEPAEQHA